MDEPGGRGEVPLGVDPSIGLAFEATVGVADDGRDHPGPGLEDCGVAVSFVVTNRECEVAKAVVGRAVR